MIDLAAEKVFSLSDFARELGKRQPNLARDYTTIRDWVKNGFSPRGHEKPIVKLESILIGGVQHTSFEAFSRFTEAQAAAKETAEMLQ